MRKMTSKVLANRVRTFLWDHLPKRDYTRQKLRPVNIGDFEIEAPANHPVFESQKTQPYRDLNVGISAKFAGRKYPDSSIIDIGANIGDTAAMIATHAKND